MVSLALEHDLKEPGAFLMYMRSHSYNVTIIADSILDNEVKKGNKNLSKENIKEILGLPRDYIITDSFLERAHAFFAAHDSSKIQIAERFLRRHELEDKPYIIERLANGVGVEVREKDTILEKLEKFQKDPVKFQGQISLLEAKLRRIEELEDTIQELNRVDNKVTNELMETYAFTPEEQRALKKIETYADMLERYSNPYAEQEFGHPMTNRPSNWLGQTPQEKILLQDLETYFIDHQANYLRAMRGELIPLDRSMQVSELFFKALQDMGIPMNEAQGVKKFMIPKDLIVSLYRLPEINPENIERHIKKDPLIARLIQKYVISLPINNQVKVDFLKRPLIVDSLPDTKSQSKVCMDLDKALRGLVYEAADLH